MLEKIRDTVSKWTKRKKHKTRDTTSGSSGSSKSSTQSPENRTAKINGNASHEPPYAGHPAIRPLSTEPSPRDESFEGFSQRSPNPSEPSVERDSRQSSNTQEVTVNNNDQSVHPNAVSQKAFTPGRSGEDWDTTTHMRAPVVEEHIRPHIHTVFHPEYTRHTHIHEHRYYVQPVIDTTPEN